MEEAKQNSNMERDYFDEWQEAERKVAELEKKLDKVERMTECLKNCKDVFNAVGPELLGSGKIMLIQGVASAQNWVQRILDESDVK